ncbi:MAG: hypothetical protein M3068_05670 [Gemmatimonadota bacterium]|nr:hypothetical protein [Gemmatimonadota bacterium]
MSNAGWIELPAWAQADENRRQHIARVVRLLEAWSRRMALDASEALCWRDAGRWHDALRDAPLGALRSLVPDVDYPAEMLHGPAAAIRLVEDGEDRADVLDAVRFHTVGCPWWGRTGRALYMADYLEPDRLFSGIDGEALRSRVPTDFEGCFREVVQRRLEWALRAGHPLFPDTVALWNSLQ